MPPPTKRQKQARKALEETAWNRMEKESLEKIAANRTKLKRKRGQFVTKEEARCILSLYFSNLTTEKGEGAAISKTAAALLFSEGSVRKAVKTWQEDGVIRAVTRKGTRDSAPRMTAEGDAH